VLWRRADPEPPRRRYSWEDESEPLPDDTLEPPAPQDVPVLWHRPPAPEERGVVLPFRRPGAGPD
jgi:hypothetical protein